MLINSCVSLLLAFSESFSDNFALKLVCYVLMQKLKINAKPLQLVKRQKQNFQNPKSQINNFQNDLRLHVFEAKAVESFEENRPKMTTTLRPLLLAEGIKIKACLKLFGKTRYMKIEK